MAFLLLLLLAIGLILFAGEALFGSMGWGILHGSLLLVGIAVACLLAAFRLPGAGLALAVGGLLGLILAVAAGIFLGGAIPNLSEDPTRLIVGAGVPALIGGVVGAIVGAIAAGLLGGLLGLVVGALLGALVGAVGAVALTHQVGAALAVTIGLLTWIGVMGFLAQRRRDQVQVPNFKPEQTIETTKETIEWVRAQTPLGRKS